jgi:hypothetical protein
VTGAGMGKKITNYKIQITNKSQITMSKITNPMYPCSHAISSLLTSFSQLPIFSASQLPSLPEA